VGIVVGAGVSILVIVIFYIVQRRKRPNNDYDEGNSLLLCINESLTSQKCVTIDR
jgi:hypothetical protein